MQLNKEKTVCIIGLNQLGLTLGILASKKGYKVIGIDKEGDRLQKVNKGISPIADSKLEKELIDNPIEATSDYSKIKYADVIVVCVQTSISNDSSIDLSVLEAALISVAHNMMPGQLIVIESEISAVASKEIVIPLLEKISGMSCGKEFYYAYCLEKIYSGTDDINDDSLEVENIGRLLHGIDTKSEEYAIQFYSSIIKAPTKGLNLLEDSE